jgi:3-phenylpropionate/trans-cinnamate dioxygenase ferredoxin subunit
MAFVNVGRADHVIEGEIESVVVGGTEIAVTRVHGQLYAFADVCSHRRCNFSTGGDLDGTELTCECHGAVFDILTGGVLAPPATQPIAIYPAREQDGELQIDA